MVLTLSSVLEAMELSEYIALGNQEPRLDFLVIGGFAVGAHGHTRFTADVDFLVRRSERNQWVEKVAAIGMSIAAETNAFIQFLPGKATAPLDLMLVDDKTFAELFAGAEQKEFPGAKALVPTLDHLLALKLHVLKQGLRHRTSKDADDVQMLVRRNKLDLRSEHYRQLFLKYGNEQIYETILRVIRY